MTTLALPPQPEAATPRVRIDTYHSPTAPALRAARRRADIGDIEIRPMTQARDLGHAWVLLARQRRWLTSLGIDVNAIQPPERDDYRDPAAYYAAPDGVLLIASRRGRPVGMAGIRVSGEHPRQADVRRLYVDVHERGKGIGRQLLQAVIEQAAVLHADQVVVETMAGRPTGAESLFVPWVSRTLRPPGASAIGVS